MGFIDICSAALLLSLGSPCYTELFHTVSEPCRERLRASLNITSPASGRAPKVTLEMGKVRPEAVSNLPKGQTCSETSQGWGQNSGHAFSSSVPALSSHITHCTCTFSSAATIMQSHTDELGTSIRCNHSLTVFHEFVPTPQSSCRSQPGGPGHHCSDSDTALPSQCPLRNQASQR